MNADDADPICVIRVHLPLPDLLYLIPRSVLEQFSLLLAALRARAEG
jgi:hypothetical protein